MPTPQGIQIDPVTGERIPQSGTNPQAGSTPQIDPVTGERVANAHPRPAGLPEGVNLPELSAHPSVSLASPPIPQISNFPRVKSIATTLSNVGKGAIKSIPGTMAGLVGSGPGGMGGGMAPIGANNDVQQGAPAASALLTAIAKPNGKAQKVGKVIGNAAQFMVPGGAEEEAAARLEPLMANMPRAGRVLMPAAKASLAAIGSGTVNKLQGGDFGSGAVGGAVGSGIGQGLRSIAPILAESALKVRGNDRLFGRTVGDAILNDTTGVRPATIANSARTKIGQLTPQLEQQASDAGVSGARGSLVPARNSVSTTIAKHTQNRAMQSAADLAPLESFLNTDAATGNKLSPLQTPSGILALKRGLNSDFISSWKPDQSPGLKSSARSVYGNLADEFHASAPGTRELDQRISSLIPVAKRAENAANGAGIAESTINKFRVPTGALSGSIAGGAAGYHEKGIPGAVAGAVGGAVLPSLFSSPEVLMAEARMAKGVLPKLVPAGNGLFQQYINSDKKPAP